MSAFFSEAIWLMRDMDPSLRWGDVGVMTRISHHFGEGE